MELAHEVVGLEHGAHGVGERESHRHGQTLGHRDNYKRHGYHDRLEHICQEGNEVEWLREQIHSYPAGDDEYSHGISDARDELAEALELLVERSLDAAVYLGCGEHLAVLGGVADSRNAHDAVTFHHFRSAHDMVGRICVFLVEFGGVGGLVTDGLARESGLVDVQADSLKQLAVGWYLVAGVEHDYVAHDNIFLGHLADVAVAYHLNGLVIVDLIEYGELAFSFLLEVEGEKRGEQDGDEYADRLEEDSGILTQSVIFIEGYADRQNAGDYQDYYQRVSELAEENLPDGIFLCRSEDVDTMLLAAFPHFRIRKSLVFDVLLHFPYVYVITTNKLLQSSAKKSNSRLTYCSNLSVNPDLTKS